MQRLNKYDINNINCLCVTNLDNLLANTPLVEIHPSIYVLKYKIISERSLNEDRASDTWIPTSLPLL